MLIRGVSALVGFGVLAAAAHVTIEHTGGYSTPHAVLTMAVAVGVAIGAITIGSAWAHGRYMVAILIGLALLCGEAFGLLNTAQRLVEARDAEQVPLRLAQQERTKAQARVAKAETAIAAISDTSPRLAAALTAKAAADRAVVEQASLRGCRKNCRALLQAQVDTAAIEVAAARAAIGQQRAKAQTELDNARSAFALLKPVRSATPLADRLGLPPWAIDVLSAVLGSLGANGLGAALLAFGGHAPPVRSKPAAKTAVEAQEAQEQPQSAPRNELAQQPADEDGPPIVNEPIRDEHKHIASFAAARLVPDQSGRATIEEMFVAYRAWCAEKAVDTLPADRTGQLLGELVQHLGLAVELQDGEPIVMGVHVTKQELRLIEGKAAW